MTRNTKIDEANALIEICLTGLVGGEEFNWGMRQIDQACHTTPVKCAVWDFREADLSQLSFAVIQGSVKEWPAIPFPDNARIAAVASSEQDEILLRLWREAGSYRDSMKRKVFRDIDAARSWAAGLSE